MKPRKAYITKKGRKNAGTYLTIDPKALDEVKEKCEEILEDIDETVAKEIGPGLKDDLKRYGKKAELLLEKIRKIEETLNRETFELKSLLTKESRIDTPFELDKMSPKEEIDTRKDDSLINRIEYQKLFNEYSIVVKAATKFVYEFRKYVTGEETVVMIAINKNNSVQYHRFSLEDFIYGSNLTMQFSRSGSGKIVPSGTKLQMTSDLFSKILPKGYDLTEKVNTQIAIHNERAAREKIEVDSAFKSYGAGRGFEVVMRQLGGLSIEDARVRDFISIQRGGDVDANAVARFQEFGFLGAEDSYSVSLKTLGFNGHNRAEIQGINSIKSDLFNIATLCEIGFTKEQLKQIFTDTREELYPGRMKKTIESTAGDILEKRMNELREKLSLDV